MARRLALAVVAVAAVAVFASGAFGFTSATVDRGVSVAVVDDESAFLGLQDRTVECREIPGSGTQPDESCADTPLLRVTNQFASEMTVTRVSIETSDGTSVRAVDDGLDLDDDLAVGESGVVRADVSGVCDPSGNEVDTVTLDVTLGVETDGVDATRYDKTLTVTCERPATGGGSGDGEAEPGEDEVVFKGSGNVDTGNFTVETYVYYVPSDDEFVEQSSTRGSSADLVAVVTENNGTYVNTKFDFETKKQSGSGGTERLNEDQTPPWESASETATPTATATETGS
ncbi:hypothetical protein [Halosegnis marinus]|uniref:Uncharacterized protein n=1 Tax=Halosegnis marinus TaxID=3034023 RepID=A0ABD5ZQI9_9EURY|nr:hypothetical protein [Halosegnis sp. DT85]